MPDTAISCIIIDDLEQAQAVLEHYIEKLDFIQLKGTFLNAVDAYNFLRTEQVDLIFLDVNMPEVDGFAFLDMLQYKPMVIVSTAYLDHAYKSFEYNAVDYLYKPIRFERFVTAVEKACKWKLVGSDKQNKMKVIEVKVDGYLQEIPVEEIIYIESLGNYIKIHCKSKTLVVFLTTKEVEEMLKGGQFVRIHKSYIVNVDELKEVNNDSVLIKKKLLPIGTTYKKYIDHLLGSK